MLKTTSASRILPQECDNMWYCWFGGQAGSTCHKTSVYTEYRIRHFKVNKFLLGHNQLTILEFSHVRFTPEKLSWSRETSNRHHPDSQTCNSVQNLLSPGRVRLRQAGWKAKTVIIVIIIMKLKVLSNSCTQSNSHFKSPKSWIWRLRHRVSPDLSCHTAPESHWLFRYRLSAQGKCKRAQLTSQSKRFVTPKYFVFAVG